MFIGQHLEGDFGHKRVFSTGYYTAVVVNKDCSWGGYKRQFFSIFFAFSKPVYQNEWENAQGGVIFGLFAVWTTLLSGQGRFLSDLYTCLYFFTIQVLPSELGVLLTC